MLCAKLMKTWHFLLKLTLDGARQKVCAVIQVKLFRHSIAICLYTLRYTI